MARDSWSLATTACRIFSVLLMDEDVLHPGRAEGGLGVEDGIRRPFDDVDLFARQFLADGQDPVSLDADAGADGVDVPFLALDGHLGPLARLPDNILDLDGSVGDLGDLELEELGQELGIGPGDDDLGPLESPANLDDDRFDAVAPLEFLVEELLP